MAKIHIIFTRDGDVFCAANSYDLAAQIALDEFQKGSLEEVAIFLRSFDKTP